ncbi:MAG: cold-shock protein [Promethearchaeota archaeon]
METGTVKWFSISRNYGFITREEGPDVFVHGSEVEGYKILSEGDTVFFEIEETPRGPKALRVELA